MNKHVPCKFIGLMLTVIWTLTVGVKPLICSIILTLAALYISCTKMIHHVFILSHTLVEKCDSYILHSQ